ncbi:MAG: ATP-binding protein [Hyphomicrobiaceae bacterium]|nr:ATP-binding protein [Hyphomicrobiaceae bacterium]
MQHILAKNSPLKTAVRPKLLWDRSLPPARFLAGSALASLAFCGPAFCAPPLAANSLEASATLTQSLAGDALNYGLLGGLVLIGGLGLYGLFATIQKLQHSLAKTERLSGHYKSQLNMMHAVLASQPQIVIELASGGAPKLLFHSLQSYSEIPAGPRELLDFASWIDEGRSELKNALLALLSKGRAFSITVRTNKGLLMEAEGRTGGEALLVFRDLSGSQRKEVRMLDEREKLENKITIMQSLFDALPMPVWFHDQRQKLTWVNRTYTKAVEAGSSQEVYEKQLELLEQRQIKAINKELERNNIFRQRMHTIIGGEPQAFETIAIPVGEQRGSIAIDVAAEESAQGKLDQHIAAHRSTLDRVSAAVAFFNAEQRLSFFNKAFADFWDLDENWLNTKPKDGEILDRLRATRMLPEQANYTSWKQEWLSIYNSEEMLEDKWFLPDGRAVHVVADQSPDGGVIYMFDNLTDTINLQSSFNELTNVQRETLDALREGVAVFATNGKLKLYNTAFTNIWNLSDVNLADEPHIEQVIHLCRALYDDDDDWDAFRHSVTDIDDERTTLEGRFQRLDETVLAFASFPLPDGATLLTFVDITDEERAELALLEKNKALQAADQLKNDFISNVSYELRTPLTSIMGFSELLGTQQMGKLNQKQREYLANITASSSKLETIISNILDLVTMDAGTFELTLSSIKISEILKAATLSVRDRLKKSDLTLDVNVTGELDDITVDGQRVIQVLYNLLQNAIGFSETGKTIRLHVKEQGQMIAFSVEDEGCGIPENIRNTVFERFERSSLGSKHRGVGLGLSIVTSIVELHGGDVELLSKEGVGTKITVRFPIKGKEELEQAAE